MSKAFTSEDSAGDDDVASTREGLPLPEGAKNYMTPSGAARMLDELHRLTEHEIPTLSASAGSGDAELTKKLREATSRARFLARRAETLEVVEPPSVPTRVVRFGASVTVIDDTDHEHVYRIVGVDEADVTAGAVSWLSPVAHALIGKEEGDDVTLHTPKGKQELAIARVSYAVDERAPAR